MTVNGVPVDAAEVDIPIDFKAQGGPGKIPQNNILNVASIALWLETPTPAEVVAAAPKPLIGKASGGRVVMWCKVRRDGSLWGCDLSSAVADSYRFWDAATALSKRFKA